jgi:hypothetical protein
MSGLNLGKREAVLGAPEAEVAILGGVGAN